MSSNRLYEDEIGGGGFVSESEEYESNGENGVDNEEFDKMAVPAAINSRSDNAGLSMLALLGAQLCGKMPGASVKTLSPGGAVISYGGIEFSIRPATGNDDGHKNLQPSENSKIRRNCFENADSAMTHGRLSSLAPTDSDCISSSRRFASINSASAQNKVSEPLMGTFGQTQNVPSCVNSVQDCKDIKFDFEKWEWDDKIPEWPQSFNSQINNCPQSSEEVEYRQMGSDGSIPDRQPVLQVSHGGNMLTCLSPPNSGSEPDGSIKMQLKISKVSDIQENAASADLQVMTQQSSVPSASAAQSLPHNNSIEDSKSEEYYPFEPQHFDIFDNKNEEHPVIPVEDGNETDFVSADVQQLLLDEVKLRQQSSQQDRNQAIESEEGTRRSRKDGFQKLEADVLEELRVTAVSPTFGRISYNFESESLDFNDVKIGTTDVAEMENIGYQGQGDGLEGFMDVPTSSTTRIKRKRNHSGVLVIQDGEFGVTTLPVLILSEFITDNAEDSLRCRVDGLRNKIVCGSDSKMISELLAATIDFMVITNEDEEAANSFMHKEPTTPKQDRESMLEGIRKAEASFITGRNLSKNKKSKSSNLSDASTTVFVEENQNFNNKVSRSKLESNHDEPMDLPQSIACSLCEKDFEISEEVLDHIDVEHCAQIRYICPATDCPLFFESKAKAHFHCSVDHKWTYVYEAIKSIRHFFVTPESEKELKRVAEAEMNLKIQREINMREMERESRITQRIPLELECNLCQALFDEAIGLKRHFVNNYTSGEMNVRLWFSCSLCKLKYSPISDFIIHFGKDLENHITFQYQCSVPTCGMKFLCQGLFAQHQEHCNSSSDTRNSVEENDSNDSDNYIL